MSDHLQRVKKCNRVGRAVILGVTMSMLAAGIGWATPPVRQSGTLLGKGTAQDKIKVNVENPVDVYTFDLTISDGGHSGWHQHPGYVLGTVKSGVLTLYSLDENDGTCKSEIVTAGQSFLEKPFHTHIAFAKDGESAVTAKFLVTIIAPSGSPPRTDVSPAPTGEGCPSH